MNVPVVVLEEVSGERWLPIWIGTSEAHSIASQMDDRRPLRPNSHDLAIRLIQRLDGEVERVVVTELKGGTYYAILSLHAGDADIEIDARPSDAIAIALRAGAPIFVREGVFAQAEERSAEPADEQRIRAAPFGGADRDGGPTGTPPATRHRTL
jgi:hypothetical protein